MKKFFLMLLAIVGLTMQANAITLTVVSGDKNDPNNNEGCQKLVDGNFGTITEEAVKEFQKHQMGRWHQRGPEQVRGAEGQRGHYTGLLCPGDG